MKIKITTHRSAGECPSTYSLQKKAEDGLYQWCAIPIPELESDFKNFLGRWNQNRNQYFLRWNRNWIGIEFCRNHTLLVCIKADIITFKFEFFPNVMYWRWSFIMSEEDQKQHLLSNKDKDKIVNIPTEKGPPLKWMTVFIFTLTSMISWGLIAAFPVYFVRCIEYFDKGRAETAIISAIMTGVYYTLSIVPGKSGCVTIFNCRLTSLASYCCLAFFEKELVLFPSVMCESESGFKAFFSWIQIRISGSEPLLAWYSHLDRLFTIRLWGSGSYIIANTLFSHSLKVNVTVVED